MEIVIERRLRDRCGLTHVLHADAVVAVRRKQFERAIHQFSAIARGCVFHGPMIIPIGIYRQ